MKTVTTILAPAAAVAVAAGLVGSPTAAAEPTTTIVPAEVTYLDSLDRFGVDYSDVGVRYMVELGYGICTNLRKGYGAVPIAQSIIRANWTSHDAWLTMALATRVLCPDMAASFNQQRAEAISQGVGTTAIR